MSATIVSDTMVVSTPEITPPPTASSSSSADLKTQIEVEFAKCELIEECKHAYIKRIRERYQGNGSMINLDLPEERLKKVAGDGDEADNSSSI
ncbi:hypothetical protein Q3G72_009368 [Acer saccharum]|nr:hypothetical protein Q3G72_009368 [Acer saccharum]